VTETIVALATPAGRAGLAVVRLSGPLARQIASRLFDPPVELEPRRATLVTVALRGASRAGAEAAPPPGAVDEAVATFFRGPASSTGEDVVEISLHGSPVVASEVIAAAVRFGGRLARAGEFTLRAFLNGRLDLTQAEAIRDLVDATTPAQARVAFDQLQGGLAGRIGDIERELFDLTARLEASVDFPDEGYHFIAPGEAADAIRRARARVDGLLADAARGRMLREGVTVAIVGRPNVGKSTLFNRLAGADRAIVTEVPGTTRDLLTEAVDIGGARVTLVDTAGVRATDDRVEREGVARAERAGTVADVAIVVLDRAAALTDDDRRVLAMTSGRPRIVVANKCDLPAAWRQEPGEEPVAEALDVSAVTGTGLDRIIGAIGQMCGATGAGELPAVSNRRHIDLLGQTTECLARAELNVVTRIGQMPETIILSDLQAARACLEEVTGKRTSDDLLESIFSTFCIGK
jgi:tRNA modification GTPase